MNEDGDPVTDFKTKSLRPFTFAKQIASSFEDERNLANYFRDYRWKVFLGAFDSNTSFYGSFKDVRLWSSLRTDAELFTYRFN